MRISTRNLVIVAAALSAFAVGAVASRCSTGRDPRRGSITVLPGQEPPPDRGVPLIGPSGWFPVLWFMDQTVGLPAPDPLGPFPEHVAVARKFVERLQRGEAEAAWRLTSPALREKQRADDLRSTWNDTLRQIGAPDPVAGERRWSTMERKSDRTPHTAAGARCTLTFLHDHARGSADIRLEIVRGPPGPMVDAFELTRNRFRRKR